MFSAERSSEHRGQDDLLTAGLGLDGLRAMVPPTFADAVGRRLSALSGSAPRALSSCSRTALLEIPSGEESESFDVLLARARNHRVGQ